MGRFGVRVDFEDNTKLLNNRIKAAMKDAMTDVVLDLKKTASEAAPHKKGHLYRTAQHEVYTGMKYLEGRVGFSAERAGFNYAKWTHEANYKLGEKSAKKKGGKSGIGKGNLVPVGKGYLENSLKFNKAGYLDYIEQKYKEALR